MGRCPPKWMYSILRYVAEDRDRESLVGDFEEVYRDRSMTRGVLSALSWYFFHLLRLIYVSCRTSIVWSVVMFSNYFKVAFRNLKKHAFYSFINIIGLAVGMACCILICLWVQDELSFDRFHENSDRLYRLVNHRDGAWTSSTAFSLGRVLKNDFPEIEMNSRFSTRNHLVRFEDRIFYQDVAFVDENFLSMFTFPLTKGDPETALSALSSMVITEHAARTFFGEEDAVGKILTFNNEHNLTISGVVQDVPSSSTMQFDILVPFCALPHGERVDQTWWLGCSSYVLLKEGVDLDDFRSKIAGTEKKYDKRTGEKEVVNDVQPINQMHLHGLNDTGPILYVYIFSFIAIIVLGIACINFINLTTARASNRAREVGMRKVVGAGRSAIVRQFFGESVFLSILSFILAIIFVVIALSYFNQLSGKTLSLDPTQIAGIILGILLIAAVAGIVSGSYPALLLSSFKPIQVLRETAASGAKSPLLRRILVIFQFSVAIILIVSSVMMQRQMHFIRNRDLGFTRENIIRLPMNDEIRENYDPFKNALLRKPSIMHVTAASNTPTRTGNINPFYWEGRGPDQYETLNFATVDYDYFKTFDMEIMQGRAFSRDFSTDEQQYIINETALRHTKLEDPIDKMFSMWDREGRVIGVVKDFHNQSLHSPIIPVVFLYLPGWWKNWTFVRLSPVDMQSTLRSVESLWNEHAGGYPFAYEFLDDVFEEQYRSDERTGRIFRDFTILAIFISCLGLFGLAAFMAEQRTKEIGIRKVLGASISNIILLISRELLFLLMIANAIGWPIAYYSMSKLMGNYAYRTNLALWVFVAAGIAALVISILTVSAQAVRAARSNPVDALKYE